jgi:GNAT superfamily N-acetyltransferase
MTYVRAATERDAPGICEVYRSEVDAWYRTLPDGSRVPSRYEDLSLFERFLHGGPWMDPEGCSAHLRGVLASGQRPLVAVEGDRVVGEMEVVVGPDHRWGRTAHIDVLNVERGFQRKGAGRALVLDARRWAKEAACATLSTNPEAAAVGFYHKCGLVNVLARQQELRLSVEAAGTEGSSELLPGPIRSFAPLEPLDHVLGRFQTSFANWVRWDWSVPGLTDRLKQEEGAMPSRGAYYRLCQSPVRERSVYLYAWAPDASELPDLLRSCVRRAKALGYDTVETTVDRGDLPRIAGMGGSLGRETMLLGSSL